MLGGMATPDEPEELPPAAVEALRQQLLALAQASALAVPELRVDEPRRQERVPSVQKGVVVVPRLLVAAGRARQLWYLAACLGRLTSPVPRQRQRIGWLLFALAGLAYVALLLVSRQVSIVWLAIVLLYPLAFWTARWERRAMDDAGRPILAAAGHDPAAIAREAFGDDPEPTAWQHLISTEPTPRERIAAASRS
jgi:hypothetical protein